MISGKCRAHSAEVVGGGGEGYLQAAAAAASSLHEPPKELWPLTNKEYAFMNSEMDELFFVCEIPRPAL